MAADLNIHIQTPEVTDEVLNIFFANTLGHPRCNVGYKQDEWRSMIDIIDEVPSIHVGEVSWLKAAIFDDAESFIPAPVMKVAEAIPDVVLIDDVLIAKIKEAFDVPNTTSYDVARASDIIKFLEEHKGEKCFTVSW